MIHELNVGETNGFGTLGNGTTTSSTTPVFVSSINNATHVTVGGTSYHACALLSDGTIKCWGGNFQGQVGDGTTTMRTSPVFVSGISNATHVSVGNVHSCARLSDGTIKCWGQNTNGQLGDGTTTSRSTPVTVSGITTAINVFAGGDNTCAKLSDLTIRCWGANSSGQVGDGTTISRSTPVSVVVSGISEVVDIQLGSSFTCARLADSTVKCWGTNGSGQLSDGTLTQRNSAVYSVGMNSIIAIGNGSNRSHQCNVKSDNTVLCAGSNHYGITGFDETSIRTVFGL